MSLPTDGYAPAMVRYAATWSFIGEIRIELHGDGTGTAPPEEFVAVLDAALPGIIDAMSTEVSAQPSWATKTQLGEIGTPIDPAP